MCGIEIYANRSVDYQSGQSDFFAGTTVEHIFAQSSKAQRTNMIDAPLSCDAMKAEKENECAVCVKKEFLGAD